MPKKLWPFIIGSIIAVVALPLIIDWLIIGNSFPSNISNSDWVGFFGGYIGSIMGCFISLIGIIWTINFTREQNRADRELQIRPLFDIRFSQVDHFSFTDSWLGYVAITLFDRDGGSSNEVGAGLLFLKNVGNGTATNIDVKVSVEGVSNKAEFSTQNQKVTTNSICQNEEAAISIDVSSSRKAPDKNEISVHELGFLTYDKEKYPMPEPFVVRLNLSYYDLLSNRFEQELTIKASYFLELTPKKDSKYRCELNLIEKGSPVKFV